MLNKLRKSFADLLLLILQLFYFGLDFEEDERFMGFGL